MRFYLDTEFMEYGQSWSMVGPDLISIGVVAEDGREFYAVSADFDEDWCNDWLVHNVLPDLPPHRERFPIAQIRIELRHFIGDQPEFWTWCGGFDYVVVTRLMGGMDCWPKSWPFWFNDIAQMARDLDVNLDSLLYEGKQRPQGSPDHHALADAKHIRELHDALRGIKAARSA